MIKGQKKPALTNSVKKRVEFLLLHEGLTQKEVAGVLEVSLRTVCNWNKKHKWSEKQKIKSDQIKFDDSLNAFIAWGSIHHPESKEQLNGLYKKFKKSI